MNELSVLRRALQWCEDGHQTVLATVVRTWGSAPRRVGSHMAIRDGGDFEGSVSGGCVEGATIQAAQEVLHTGESRQIAFGVSTEDAWTVGLACGGEIEIILTPVDTALLTEVTQAITARKPIQVCWHQDNAQVEPLTRHHGKAVDTSADAVIRRYPPRLRMAIVGASHIAQALAPMAALLDYAVHVVDPRSAFTAANRWPNAKVHTTYADEWVEDFPLDSHTAVVVLSHDPKIDDPGLEAALSSNAFYIGALGSRRSHAARRARLSEAGHPPEALDRIHGPVGLDIGAATPAEIATAILAECTQVLRKGQPE